MTRRNTTLTLTTVAILALAGLAMAQQRQEPPAAEEATVSGRLVDLHYAMTGRSKGKDATRSVREALKRGAAVCLETSDGIVLLGLAKDSSKKLGRFAMKPVELTGKLHTRDGMRYLVLGKDMPIAAESVERAAEAPEHDDEG